DRLHEPAPRIPRPSRVASHPLADVRSVARRRASRPWHRHRHLGRLGARHHRGLRGRRWHRHRDEADLGSDRSAGAIANGLPFRCRSPRGSLMRLLDGPDRPAPLPNVGSGFIDALERAGLAGRGGAGFPTAVKWRAVAQRSRGDAVIVVNGAEGEPQSKKDRVLMSARPHLILDGAFLAARVLRAGRIVLYVGERHDAARNAMLRALAQRAEPERRMVTVSAAPSRYVAGAETAAIHLINEGVATPTTAPPYPFERGVGGAPTLVQNVETLAHVALIARTGDAPNTVLVTLAGGVKTPGVLEVEKGTTVAEA